MSTEMKDAQFRFIPVQHLVLSPLNVRKSDVTAGIEQLAQLIHAEGVLQNLNVHEQTPEEGRAVIYPVVAGGRRLRALQWLVEHRRIEPDYPVPCMVVGYERAVQISLSENSGREPMHPADEFEAFRQLIDAGQTVEDVAARFGVAPTVVQRRLKLANVSPQFIALYREGDLTLEHLMAFAVTEDHERQQQAWDALKPYQCQPDTLRELLTQSEVSAKDPMARFIGLKAYQKAGGMVRRDLFSEEDAVMLDAALVQTLALQKLGKHAEKLRDEGLAWVELHPNFDYATRSTYGRVMTIQREPTAKEQQSLRALEDRQVQLDAQGEEALDEEDDTALGSEWQEVQERIDTWHDGLRVPDPQQQAVAGAVVHIGQDGKVCIVRDLLKPDDAERFAREQKASKRTASAGARQVHSAALVRRLTAQRTLALQAELVQQPMTAAIALTHRLALEVFYPHSGSSDSAVRISFAKTGLAQHVDELQGTSAEQTLAAHRTRFEEVLPDNPDDLLAWLTAQSGEDLLALLAYCVATSVDGVRSTEDPGAMDALAQVAKLDMRRWWTATAKSYFGGVPKSQILAAVTEAVSASAAASLEKLKKGALAEEAERRLTDTGWLPGVMRTPA